MTPAYQACVKTGDGRVDYQCFGEGECGEWEEKTVKTAKNDTIMVRKLQNLLIFLLLAMGVEGNNIRSGSTVEIVEVVGDTAVLQFDLQWDNSWRDDYNWDAAWVFLKYKESGGDWQPVYLGASGHAFTGDYTYMAGRSGANVTGLYVSRSKNSAGATSTTCRLKWKLPVGMTQEKFKKNQAFIMAQAVEMVLVPYGAYYLGDGVSKSSFQSIQQRIIPAADDMIGTDPKFIYSCLPMPYYKNASPAGAADRLSIVAWPGGTNPNICHISVSNHPAAVCSRNTSWTVNFKERKTVRTFGVSSPTNSDVNGNYLPSKDWFLLGSNDSLTWDTLKHCQPSEMIKNPVSYPVRHAIRVTRPGAYQYYRLFFLEMCNGTNGFMLANVAMSERDLYPSDAYLVDSEDKIAFGKGFNQLYANDGATWTGEMAAAYPKGYKGFYVMKYELSQEQYVAFLNTLTFVQQAERVPGLATMKQGEYVFGERTKPSNRNGIIVNVPSTGAVPVIFANNLNNDTKYNQADDGKTIACNYMTPEDIHTYCSWSGLRPMSELEYEKASRTPYPETPKPGEYAWNDNATPAKASTVNNGGMANERPAGGIVNAGSLIEGPVRSGSFAKSGSSQAQAGATYWGVMEMSGNLKELCITATGTLDGFVSGSSLYNKAVTGWTVTPAHYGLRGGGFTSADERLRTSDRSAMTVSAVRDSTVGFRGVGVLSGSVLNGGILTAPLSGCAGEPLTITGTSVSSDAPVSYLWYVKAPGGAYEMIAGATDVNLTYDQLVNTTSAAINYTFQRKAFSAIGEGLSDSKSVTVSSTGFSIAPTTAVRLNLCDVASGSFVATPSMLGGNFTWSYKGGSTLVTGATYKPARSHFSSDAIAGGQLPVTCKYTIGGCTKETVVLVDVASDNMVCNPVSYGGEIYNVVRIGCQCWMVQDLKFGKCDPLDYTAANSEGNVRGKIGTGLYGVCRPNTHPGAGYLYNWQAAMQRADAWYGSSTVFSGQIQGICPEDWHLPSGGTAGEFQQLATALGNPAAINPGGVWQGVLGGNCHNNGALINLGSYGYYWSSTGSDSSKAYALHFYSGYVGSHVDGMYYGSSIRCVKDY